MIIVPKLTATTKPSSTQSRLGVRTQQADALRQNVLTLIAQGHWLQAYEAYQASCVALPVDLPLHLKLAEALTQGGLLPHAIEAYEAYVRIDKSNLDIIAHLAVLLLQHRQFAAAEQHLTFVYSSNPSMLASRDNLYYLMRNTQDAAQIRRIYQWLIQHSPMDPLHYSVFEKIANNKHWTTERIDALKLMCLNVPNYPDGWALLAHSYFMQRQFKRAVHYYQHVLLLAPNNAQAHFYYALSLERNNEYEQAIKHFDTAIKLKPDYDEARCFKAGALTLMGQHDAAKVIFEAILSHNNDDHTRTLYIFMLNYLASTTAQSLYQASLPYQQAVELKLQDRYQPFNTWQTQQGQQGKLRVGFVSPDFVHHPVGVFIQNVINALKSYPLELVAFMTNAACDDVTVQLKAAFDQWHDLSFSTDIVTLATAIHNQQIDVLIDLAGHTSQHRLGLFALRPAPVQATWLGYYATTGITAMDYIITDPVSTPVELMDCFSEKTAYLSQTRMSFTPRSYAPTISNMPWLSNGYVTFGCVQGVKKINNAVLQAWRAILTAVPSARLHIVCLDFKDAYILQTFQHALSQLQFNMQQVTLIVGTNHSRYLAQLADMDILLDTFPFTGGTTTAEGLWMGVPTLTIAGKTMVARQGASLMSAAGLAQFVADSEAHYVAKAIALANTTEQLQAIAHFRHNARALLPHTAVFNAAKFANEFNALLHQMWQRYEQGLAPQTLAVSVTEFDL